MRIAFRRVWLTGVLAWALGCSMSRDCPTLAPVRAPSCPMGSGAGTAAAVMPRSSASAPSEKRDLPVRLTREQAERDARYLIRLLELSHPDPYSALGGKVAFKRKESDLLRSLPPEGIDSSAFGERLQVFLAGLHDGHTFMRLGDRASSDAEEDIPLRFGLTEKGLFLSGYDPQALDGCRGLLLTAVNGKSVAQLLDAIAAQSPTENMYQGYARLRRSLRSRARLAKLLPRIAEGEGISFEFESPTRAKLTRVVPATALGAIPEDGWRSRPRHWQELKRTGEPFSFQVFEKRSVVYFRVANIMGREAFELGIRMGWGDPMKDMRRYYDRAKAVMPPDRDQALAGIPSFLDKAEELLARMKQDKIRRLVIDLRGNGGGATPMVYPFLYEMYGDAYFARPLPGEFVQVQSQLWLDKMNKTVEEWRREEGKPELEVGRYSFMPPDNRDAVSRRNDQIEEWKKAGLSYASRMEALGGKPVYTPEVVYVLCDPDTFSAAFHFMFYLRSMGAKVVGVPSGQAPNTFMEVTPFVLPDSGLEGSISNAMQVFLPSDRRGDVLAPDYLVSHEIARRYDFDEDAAVRYALDLIAAHAPAAPVKSLPHPE